MKKLLVYCLCFSFSVTVTLCQKQQTKSSDGAQKIESVSQNPVPAGWKIVDLESFSFLLPKSMADQKVRGIDSEVWKFKDEEMELGIDSGLYEVTFEYDLKDFQSESKWIEKDGVKGQFFKIDFSKPKKGIAETSQEKKEKAFLEAIVFYRGKNFYSSFWVRYKNADQKETAEKILKSIKFKQK